jgi:hypothetical protein
LAGSVCDTSGRASFDSLGDSRQIAFAVLTLDLPSAPRRPTFWFSTSASFRSRKISTGWLRFGGTMLVKVALVLLAVWLIGILGVYDIGDAVHVLLLVGGMLLLLGALKARDAATAAAGDVNDPLRKL